MDMLHSLEQAVSTLNHEMLKIKKEHKQEKKELLKQLDEFQDRENLFKE